MAFFSFDNGLVWFGTTGMIAQVDTRGDGDDDDAELDALLALAD